MGGKEEKKVADFLGKGFIQKTKDWHSVKYILSNINKTEWRAFNKKLKETITSGFPTVVTHSSKFIDQVYNIIIIYIFICCCIIISKNTTYGITFQ